MDVNHTKTPCRSIKSTLVMHRAVLQSGLGRLVNNSKKRKRKKMNNKKKRKRRRRRKKKIIWG